MQRWKSIKKVRWKRIGDGIYVLVAVIVAFSIGYYLFGKAVGVYLGKLDDGAEAAVLFGTGTLVLTGVAFLVAVVAFYGWDNIKGKVEDEVQRCMQEERRYDKAQGRFTQGVSFGAVAMFFLRLPKEKQTGERDPQFLLDMAISFTERSLDDLEGTDLEYHAKNNLAFYLALRGWKRDARRALWLLEEAERSHKSKGLPLTFLLTKGEVLAKYAGTTEGPQETQLQSVLEDLEEASRVSEMEPFKRLEYDLVVKNLRLALRGFQSQKEKSGSA